jgi:coenzyme PQQ synthesis protein D (PqqD)
VQATVGSTELYVRTNAVVTRCIAGETLVLPVRGDIGDLACFYSLNGTGTTIWEALEKPKSFKELCDVVDERYDIGRKKAEEDVALFVRDICSLGLAKVVVESENWSGTANQRIADNHTARL